METSQAETDHYVRLVEAVKGHPVCRVYHAWRTGGLVGLEPEIRRREAEKEKNATKSQSNH